jgi:predicted transcriptional regulator
MSDDTDLVALTTDVVTSFLSQNNVGVKELPALIAQVHAAFSSLGEAPAAAVQSKPEHMAATTVRKSLASPDHILSMIDGKPYRTLRRHLKKHGLTPDEYRARYGLKPDYPMVAPSYSAARAEVARSMGLGRKAQAVEAVSEPTKAAPKARPRKLGIVTAKPAAKEHRGEGSAAEG